MTTSGDEGTFVALLPAPHEQAVIVMAPTEFARLALEPDAEPCCVIHRPLGARACAEAQRRLEQLPAPASHNESVARGSHAPSPWTDATDFDTLVPRLIEAATQATRVVLDSPRSVLIGGPGPIDFVAERDLASRQDRSVEVPTPAHAASLTGEQP